MNIKVYRPFGFSSLATAFFLGLLTLLSGCGSGGGEPAAPTAAGTLAISPSTSTGTTGQTLTFVVTGGAAGYTVTSNNPSIATVSAVTSSGGQYSFTATLISAGEVALTVVDSKNATAATAVTVSASSAASLITSAPGTVTIGIGATYKQSYTIVGGTAPYAVTSANTNVATATSSGATVTITGVAAGTTTVLVTDATGAASATITVNVAAVAGTGFTVLGNVTWTIGGNADSDMTNDCTGGIPPYAVYYVNGGIPPYTVSSTAPQIGTVMLTAPTAAVTASATTVTVAATGGSFVVAWPNSPCVGSGTASFEVMDSTGTVVSPAPTFTVAWTPS